MMVQIRYIIRANSGILVGSTAEVLNIGIDKTTIRRRRVLDKQEDSWNQEPVIPGSTMKGKIRNECERIVRGLGRSMDVCFAPRPETMCPHVREQLGSDLCSICELFGGPSNKSRLFFSDAIAVLDHHLAQVATRVQAGVSISRKRRTAEDERLYYIERAVEGISYEGLIDCYLSEELANQQLALLIVAIESLISIGGSKSRGAGWVEIKIKSITINDKEISNDEILKIREGLKAWRESK
jgi:CRISPR/Cas system CSM-associated protein Csm3 (group 7 of RAMP superfamily)